MAPGDIHVADLARGHVSALKKLEERCGLFVCNLGTGKGYSVLEVLRAYEKACGKTLPYVVDPRRPGDIAECYADPGAGRAGDGVEGALRHRGDVRLLLEVAVHESGRIRKIRGGGSMEKPVLVVMAAGMGSRYGGC